MATERVLTDRELLERFKEEHPEFGSTEKIAEVNEEQFALQYADAFSDGSGQARRVHKTAVDIHERTALIWANIKDVVASPYYQGALFNNIEIPQSFIDYLQQIPAYNRLFGSLDFLECDHCRSIFGPAAYFVDLLRFVEQSISGHPDNDIPEDHHIEDRRPDLPHIRLDFHNAYDLIPYIDLVNEVLEAIIRTDTMPDAYQVLEESEFPMTLPFNLPLAEIRSYLAQLKTSLPHIYQTFEQEPDDKKSPICREFLELSPREFSLIISEISSPVEVLKHYGGAAVTGADGLENVAIFLEQTGLTRQELNELVYQDLDRHEINAGLSRLFFINNADDGLGHLMIEQDPEYPNDPSYASETLLNLSYAKLDRIYRFLKLSRKLGWSFVELDTALRSLQPAYVPEKVLKFDGINDYVRCLDVSGLDLDSFTIEAWVNPTRLKENPIIGKGSEEGDDGKHKTHFLFWIDCEGKLAYYDDHTEDEESYARGHRQLPEGKVSHVALTAVTEADTSEIVFYVNGQLDNRIARDVAITPLGTELHIGRDLDDAYFEGITKDVRIWDGVRSQQSLAEYRYQRLTGREQGLVGYWPLIETRGNTLCDHTAQYNDGVMGGDEFVTQPTWVHRDLILDPMPELVEQSSAFQFNGSDQYLAVRDATGLETDELTIEAWVQMDALAENHIVGLEDRVDIGGAEQVLTRFLLRVDPSGNLVFGDSDATSNDSIPASVFTHVCATLSEQELSFYINGVLDSTGTIPAPPVYDELLGSELLVGRSPDAAHYYGGQLKEIRIWNTARDAEQIAMHMHRPVPAATPGLIAYWRLNGIEEGKVSDVPHNQATGEGGPYEFTSKVGKDLTGNQNDLYVGGMPGDYMPDQMVVDTLMPALPVETEETVFQFDGTNDVFLIQNPENTGLGKHERLTLELWFRATDSSLDRNQVVCTQGDKEAGLNAYLFDGSLYVMAWCAGYEGENPQETVFTGNAIASGQWHHLAIVNDESLALDNVVFRAFLDGTELALDSSTHPDAGLADDQKGYRLSPVGAAYLGGVGQQGVTRFMGDYSVPDDNHLHYFAGQITDLRLWKKAKTQSEIAGERFAAPSREDPDLLAYLPMDEGQGEAIQDTVPSEPSAGYNGILQARNITFVNDGSNPELENCYSHYAPDGIDVLAWKDYAYRGRMYVASEDSAVGVTFFSRYPEDADQFYRLRRYKQRRAFHLAPHPHGIQEVSGTLDSGVDPMPGAWYRFCIEVEDAGTQTDIRAKIWPDGDPEPTDFQINAFDDSPGRIRSGTAGVWTFGPGEERFDDLEVLGPPAGGSGGPTRLLDENFEAYSSQEDPDGWKDTSIRVYHDEEADVFRTVASQENRVFGTESELDDIHAHYYPPGDAIDFTEWEAYEYTGRLYMTEQFSGIGLTFFNLYPKRPLKYYRLRRWADEPWIHLDKHPATTGGLHGGTKKSDVVPEANTWYRFRIQVEHVPRDGSISAHTTIKARVWQEGTAEPGEWQIDAFDSDSPFKYGTVGFWTKGSGTKYFDDLQVSELPLTNPPTVLLAEDFASFPDDHDPPEWVATGAGYSLDEVPGLFETSTVADIGFGTDLDVENVHSHYMPDGVDVLSWENYDYSGRMYVAGEDSGVGVTFLSRYPEDRDQYYSLRRDPVRPAFHLAPHPHGIQAVSGAGAGAEITTAADTWYRFRIQVEDLGTQTNIRAKVWPDGSPEPPDFQIEAYDDTDIRIGSGTVGIWATGTGAKYFDDLKVESGGAVLLDESFGGYPVGEKPTDWRDTAARSRFDEDPGLFRTLDVQDNLARWASIDDYPLLLHPLDGKSLQFDGQRKYVGRDVTALDVAELTLEAWVNPDQAQQNPIVTLGGDGQVIAELSINPAGQPELQIEGQNYQAGTLSITPGQFTHLAVSAGSDGATFYVHPAAGSESSEVNGTSPPATNTVNYIEIGRNMGNAHFWGLIGEVRLWSSVRSQEQINAGRYQIPDLGFLDLVGYWPFVDYVENDGVKAADASALGNPLRLGGPERARRPTLSPADWTPTAQEAFWQPDRQVLEFNGTDDTVSVDDHPGINLDLHQRRTVEVWFAVEDKDISSRTQVIYKEGDAERGLVLYVHQGLLYFGGYNLPEDESNWSGTWLSTDRIVSGRWHHAALVLDGRPEVRDGSLQGFLDGKVVDVGPGSQLWPHPGELTLGGSGVGIRCHDEAFTGVEGQFFQGQMLELRVWNTARTPDEIEAGLYGPLTGGEDFLELWWRFDQSDGTQILDESGHSHDAATSRTDQLQPIGALPAYQISPIPLDEEALCGIATIKKLKDEYRWSMDKLSALWHGLKHTGREDQKILYDQVYNPEGVVVEPWPYYLDQPVLWDITGERDRSGDRRTRNRLMGALQVSHDDLNRLVASLSGPEENIIELDGNYLANLYRLAKLPGLLRLSVQENTRLLAQMGLEAVGSLEDLAQLVDRAEWMRRTGIDIYELDFLAYDIQSEGVSFGYTEADIRDLADDLARQSRDFLVKPDTLVSGEISQYASQAIFDYLSIHGFIDSTGAVTPDYTELADLAGLATSRDWRQAFVDLDGDIFDALKTGGIVDDNGLVLVEDLESLSDDDLLALFAPGSEPDLETLDLVKRTLSFRKEVQDQVINMLLGRREEHANAILAGISGLVGVDPEGAQPVLGYFRDHELVSEGDEMIAMGPSYFLELMMGLQEDEPIPEAIADYLYKLSKILYLTDQFDLSTAETLALIESPEQFSVEQFLTPGVMDLDHLYLFQELKTAFADTEGLLLNLLTLDGQDGEATAEAIVELSGWERRQLDSLMAYFGPEEQYHRVTGLDRLKAGFDLAALLGVDIGFVIELAVTEDLGFGFYRDQSAALLKILRARYSDEQWPKVYKPIHDPLAVLRRDALISKAMLQVSAEYEGRRDPDILSQYVLIDVQTGSEVDTSRIVQAIASVQLYVQRCLMNLEKGVKPEAIPVEQWEWMKNYRVWEANRKVFLYPENYIEPELRDTKTPLFETLEMELMQNDVNQAAVEKAYGNYLHGFAEVATLEIVGSYLHKELNDPEADEILYLVGRTSTQPGIYYHREYINGNQWLPWKKIDLPIKADVVSPVYAFGRLFLFWVEFTESTEAVGDSGDETATIYRPNLQYSYLNLNGSWIQPQPYDLGIPTAAADPAVGRMFGAADAAYRQLQTTIGQLSYSWYGTLPVEQVVAEARLFASAIREFADTIEGVLVNTSQDDAEITDLANSLRSAADDLETRATALEQAVLPEHLFDFWFLHPFLILDHTADIAFSGLTTAFDRLGTMAVGQFSLGEQEHLRPEWQRIYAQRAVEFAAEGPQEQFERNARVLEVAADTDIQTTTPDYAMDELTWSFWVHFGNASPDGWAEDREESATLFDYADSLQATVTNNSTPITDAIDRATWASEAEQHAGDAEMAARDAETSAIAARDFADADAYPQAANNAQEAADYAQEAADKAQAAADAADSVATSATAAADGELEGLASGAKTAAEAAKAAAEAVKAAADATKTAADAADAAAKTLAATAVTLAGDASDAAESAADAAETLVQAAAARPQYRSDDMDLEFELASQATAFQVEFGKWYHAAITLAYNVDGYDLSMQLYSEPDDTSEDGTLHITSDLLPTQGELILGEQDPGVSEVFSAQMSEFRLWNSVRELTDIEGDRDERMTGSQYELFHLPLNRQIPDATMAFIRSTLTFRFTPPGAPIPERERIVLFYGNGDLVRTRRNNADDRSFILTLADPDPDGGQYDLALSPLLDLYIGLNLGVVTADFEAGAATDQNFLLRQPPGNVVTVLDVHNQPGWYILNTGDEQFLLQADVGGLQTTSEVLNVGANAAGLGSGPQQALTVSFDPVTALAVNGNGLPQFAFERLSTFAVHELSVSLFRGGLDALLSLESQQAAEVDFELYTRNTSLVIPPRQYNNLTDTIDFDGAYGLYYREIFFHLPFLIANSLNANQNFAEAQNWYHYVFNPTAQEEEGSPVLHDRYWRFLPFRGLNLESLADMLSDGDSLEAYRLDPFDPHAIARLRLNAYQKAIVMKYIDNLLDWGDYLFGQDTRESINEAVMLYLLAYDLLGPRPKAKTARQFKEIGDYQAIRETHDPIPDFLAQLNLPVPGGGSGSDPTPHSHLVTDFCVVENAQFAGYWDQVLERLFKIRHSMNIEGVFRQLALFEPPINPAALVAAVAGGRDIGSLLSDVSMPVPHYRYAFMLEKAKEMISTVIDLGSSLLSAIESRDAEQLALLQNTQEKTILDLMTQVKEYELEETGKALDELAISRARVDNRREVYQGRIDEYMNGEEIAELVLEGVAQGLKTVAQIFKMLEGALGSVPDVGAGGAGIASPVAVTIVGGKQYKALPKAILEAMLILAEVLNTAGSMTAKMGGYKRRKSEWTLEKDTAAFELQEIDLQIEMAQLKRDIAQREIVIHNKTIEHNEQVASFYRQKFSNEALYNWMVSRLSGLYFQAYKLAYDLAKKAQMGVQYELPTSDTYISFGHWDSLKKGLLAGESLMLELRRMEKAHLEQDSRFQDIEKTISMAETMPGTLLLLQTLGEAEFQLGEGLFNQDFPGHYARMIKTLAISIKTEGVPPQEVHATLTQLGSKLLLEPNLGAVQYLMGIEGAEQPDTGVIRTNWRANQAIALSRPVADDGMFGDFDLNLLFDDRYFPFEGTGAVSDWMLEIPAGNNSFDLSTITDVVIHLKYTAKFDRGEFRTQVRELAAQ